MQFILQNFAKDCIMGFIGNTELTQNSPTSPALPQGEEDPLSFRDAKRLG